MGEGPRIAEQLRRAFEGEAWHGPALMELLAGVGDTEAAARPLPGAHTIWEIVHHVAAWEAIGLRRLQGERLVDVSQAEDWPPVVERTAAAWARDLEAARQGNARLRAAVAALDDARLTAMVPGMDYDNYVLLHGVVQHDLYHAGQIAVLKKGLATGPK